MQPNNDMNNPVPPIVSNPAINTQPSVSPFTQTQGDPKVLIIFAFIADWFFPPLGIVLGIVAYKRAGAAGTSTKLALVATWIGVAFVVGTALFLLVSVLAVGTGKGIQF